jgi:hypothetical protein
MKPKLAVIGNEQLFGELKGVLPAPASKWVRPARR